MSDVITRRKVSWRMPEDWLPINVKREQMADMVAKYPGCEMGA